MCVHYTLYTSITDSAGGAGAAGRGQDWAPREVRRPPLHRAPEPASTENYTCGVSSARPSSRGSLGAPGPVLLVWAGDGEGRGCADFRVGGVTARTPHGPTVAIGGLNAPHIPGPGGKRRADPWPCWAPPGASRRPPSPAPLVPGLRQLPGGEGQAGGWGRCGRFFRLRRTLHVLPLPRRFAWGRNPAMAGTPRPGPARHCRPSRTFHGPRGLCHAPSERPTQLAPRLRTVREPASPQVCRRESRWTRPPDHLTGVLGGGQ